LVRWRFLLGTASDEGRGIALGLLAFEYDEWVSVVEYRGCEEMVLLAKSAAAEAEMLCVLRRFVSICDSFWRPVGVYEEGK
jgi:hypothetical protein